MLRNLLASLGIGLAATGSAQAAQFYKPYAEYHVNFLYNLLFCDDLALFKNKEAAASGSPWSIILADNPDVESLQMLAEDGTNEGRVRALAYGRLRAVGAHIAPKRILGVIVEVPQPKGLDVLAAFSEGGVRYLNQSGKVAIFEGGGHPLETLARELVAAAQPLVNRIGPWDKSRRPPPSPGSVRITFLVSDGLYFGEGPFVVLQRDPMAGPILAKAALLLEKAVDVALK